MKQFELKFYREWYDTLVDLSHDDRAAAALALPTKPEYKEEICPKSPVPANQHPKIHGIVCLVVRYPAH